MISTEIPFVNYVFITITAGVMAFVTLMDEGTVVNKEETTVPPIVEEPNDIFSSVSANDNNESAFNSLPSIFKTPENEVNEVPPPQPLSNDIVEQEEPAENNDIPMVEPVAEQIPQEPEQTDEKTVEENENKPAQGGYKKKTKRKIVNNRKTKRK